MAGTVRVRFAPSPTGYFHVGGARTALFNWLFARHHGGAMVLRIEDTDVERNREEWVEGITDSLTWLGLDWDEGPFRQSQRIKLYTEAAEQLFSEGRAYYCDCTREAVEGRASPGAPPGYDGYCRDRRLEPGPGRALRFRVPDDGSTTVVDVIRGSPTFENRTIEDFVVVRSNGMPIFILASVVDDIDMGITHVIRGEEHLPNTPKSLMLWEALGGGDPPAFAHVPVLVNERRQKLSKRRDKVAVEDYRAQGFLPEALRNYLCLLGWAPRDGREVLALEEMVEEFRLEDVTPSPAFFDERKLLHFNAEYLRRLSTDDFATAVGRFLERPFRALAPLVQERVRTLSEVPGMVEFLFLPLPHLDPSAWDKRVVRGPHAAEILSEARERYAGCEWTASTLHEVTAAIGEGHGLGLAKAQFPVRVAVTGTDVGPPLFESLEVLGRERTLERLEHAIARLKG